MLKILYNFLMEKYVLAIFFGMCSDMKIIYGFADFFNKNY